MRTDENTRLVRVSADLLDALGARTEDGRRLTAEWGDPIGNTANLTHDEPIYEPTITATDDGHTVVRKDICRHVKGTA